MVSRSLSPYALLRLCRQYATTASIEQDPKKIRNIALVAHIDSGKTTLTESILLKSDYLETSGTVDTGSTTTDFLPAERERGITIQSASIPVKWNHRTYNLIDTPGHADFGMEVESASRVIDGAVLLIDSVEGVEAQTKGVWSQLNRYGVKSRIAFLNKLDRPGASFRNSIASIVSHSIHPNPLPVCLPIASFEPQNYHRGEPGVEGLVDLVKWEAWRWDSDGQPTRHALPKSEQELRQLPFFAPDHPIIPALIPSRSSMLEHLAQFSDEILDIMLSAPPPTDVATSTILGALRQATLKQEILPVLCGSAMKHVGTDMVLDYVGDLLAGPLDVLNPEDQSSGPLKALAWKVTWDSKKGWMTFVRIYSGTLSPHTPLVNITQNQKEKAAKLILLYASRHQEVQHLPFGSVGVILGLKHTRTGDTLVASGAPRSGRTALQDIVLPPALVSASIIPQSHSDLAPVQSALTSLSRTDPSLRVEDKDGQLLIHGLGALHLEIVERRLKEEWNTQFELGKPRVSYRETVSVSRSTDLAVTLSSKEVKLSLEIRPLGENLSPSPSWDGNKVVDPKGHDIPSPESLGGTPMGHIALGIANVLSASPHYTLPLTGVMVSIRDFHVPDPPTLLAGAAARILSQLIRETTPVILEPYIQLRITVPEEGFGKVVKNLTEHNAEILDMVDGHGAPLADERQDSVYLPPAWLSPAASSVVEQSQTRRVRRIVTAIAPLSSVLDYAGTLKALTGGHGQFLMSSEGFKEVSQDRTVDILKEIGRM